MLIILFIYPAIHSFGASYYVSTSGSDANDGTSGRPFRSIGKAAAVLKPGDICHIDDGLYAETVQPARSGRPDAPIVFKKMNGNGRVVITGLDSVSANRWQKGPAGLYAARCEMNLGHENQVFLGGRMLLEARWPNSGDVLLEPVLATMKKGTTKTLIVDSSLPGFDLAGAKAWIHAPKYWSDWTTSITGNPEKGRLEIVDSAPFHEPSRHVAVEGATYFIFGFLDALDSDGEWFYDEKKKTLYVYRENGKLPKQNYYIKTRMTAFDLRARSHVKLEGIEILGATIETSAKSSHLIFDSMRIQYPYFSSLAAGSGAQADKGVRLLGSNCILKNSEVAYSSGTGVALYGENNQVLNCYIHDHDFIGTYASCVQLGGKGNVISHSTLTRSGRSVIDYGAMYQSLVQNCELSYAGMLTGDLGLTYGNVIEGGNSEIRYNVLRHNVAHHHSTGLYYDHGTQNIISHHNIVYGVELSAFHLNHYASFHLIYNNTFIAEKFGFRNIWGNKYAPELNGVRIVNNVFSQTAETAAPDYFWSNNITDYEGFDPKEPFRIDPDLMERGLYLEGISRGGPQKRPGIGAIESENGVFRVGHDFRNPPEMDTTRSRPRHRNLIINSAFEHEDHLDPWTSVGDVRKNKHKPKLQIDEDIGTGRMGAHSVELAGNRSEIRQVVTDLEPDCTYQFSGFLRVDKGERAVLGVRFPDGQEFTSPDVTFGAPAWRRVNLSFSSQEGAGDVVVFVRRLSQGSGNVYFDDAGLVLTGR